jgi:hypothetical protein
MRKIVSRDPQYVSGETCLFKWSEGQSFSPARMRPCGKPAVAGIGFTRAGAAVHPSDPQAVGDLFACERHVKGLLDIEDGSTELSLVPRTPPQEAN